MNDKIKLSLAAALTVVIIMLNSGAGQAEQTSSDELYNPRDEVLYGYRAKLEREEAHNRQIQFNQYQQQQYLEAQKLKDQQNMYNQSHQKIAEPAS